MRTINPLGILMALLAASILGQSAGAAGFELRSTGVDWEQVDRQKSFTVFIEREEFSPLDRVGRMVFVTQTGVGGAKLQSLSVHWQVRQGETLVAENTASMDRGLVDVGFSLAGLSPGRYDVSAELLRDRQTIDKGQAFFRLVEVPEPAQKGRIPLLLPRGLPLKQGGYPVIGGVPFSKGVLWNKDNVRIVTAEGQPVPAQCAIRSRWGHTPETSIRWLGVEFQPQTAPAWWPERKDTRYFLEFGPDVKPAAVTTRVQVKEAPEGFAVDTGAMQFLVRRDGFNLIDRVRLNGKEIVAATAKDGLYLIDHEGATYRAANDRAVKLTVEEQGDLRVVLCAEGWYVRDGTDGARLNWTLPTDKLCKFITRIEAYAGKPYVRVLNTWVLTYDSNTVRLKDVGFSLPVDGCTDAEFGVDGADPILQTVGTSGVHLIQHLPNEFCIEDGAGKELGKGQRSAGWMVASTKNCLVAVGHRETWQRFPKEMEALPGELKFHVWPAHGRTHPEIDPVAPTQIHKLWFAQQGSELNLAMPWDYYFAVAKMEDNPDSGIYKPAGMPMAGIHSSSMGVAVTSDFLIHFAGKNAPDEVRDVAACFQTAPHVLPDTKWLCGSLAMGYIHPYDPENMKVAEECLDDFSKGYWETQNACGEYGMWVYRTWHHTTMDLPGRLQPYRLYNATHHYDAFMPWMLYARSGDPFYLTQGSANMRLLTDLQVVHYDNPEYPHKEFHFGQGRLVGSTKHTNGFCTWGGDHAVLAHLTCYNSMMLAYYLTGDLRWKEVVEEWQGTLLSDRKNPEFALADRSKNYTRDGARDVTNSLGEMIDLYQFSYDPRVLAHMAPMMDFFLNKFMRPWGLPVQNVLLFYGSEQARRQLLEGVETYRKVNGVVDQVDPQTKEKKTVDPKALWYTHSPFDNFALASIIDPKSNAHIDAWLLADVAGMRAKAAECRKQIPKAVTFCKVADYVVYLPRTMYALAQAGGGASLSRVASAQPMPAADLGLGGWMRSVVQKNDDQPFEIKLWGKVQINSNAQVRILGPDNDLLGDVNVPAGEHAPFVIRVLGGKPGQYAIFVKAPDGKASFVVPLTDLPEVHVVGYWAQYAETRFFTRAKGQAPEVLGIQPHVTKGQILSADGQRQLAATDKGEMMTVTLGQQGVWINARSRYVHPKGTVILAVSPDRWFLPSEDKIKLKPE